MRAPRAVLVIVTLKLALTQYQISRPQHLAMLGCLLLWWPISWMASWHSWITAGSFTSSMVLNYAGMFQMVQGEPCYWLLLLLVPAFTQLLHLFVNVYQRAFYPEFRDLAMEAEWHRLPTEHLERWQIPLAQRRLPLRKDAPRPLEAGRSWSLRGRLGL